MLKLRKHVRAATEKITVFLASYIIPTLLCLNYMRNSNVITYVILNMLSCMQTESTYSIMCPAGEQFLNEMLNGLRWRSSTPNFTQTGQ